MPKKKSFSEEFKEAPSQYAKAYKEGLGLDPDKDYVEAAKQKAKKLGEEMSEGAAQYADIYKKSIGMKRGGKMPKSKVSTGQKSGKSKNW